MGAASVTVVLPAEQRVRPAIAAGLAGEPRPVDWLVELVDIRAPKSNRPARYMTAKRRAELEAGA